MCMGKLPTSAMQRNKQRYVLTEDADRLAPRWLADRVDYRTVKYLYIIWGGHEELKGVRIGDEFARIGDTIVYDGKRISIERR